MRSGAWGGRRGQIRRSDPEGEVMGQVIWGEVMRKVGTGGGKNKEKMNVRKRIREERKKKEIREVGRNKVPGTMRRLWLTT